MACPLPRYLLTALNLKRPHIKNLILKKQRLIFSSFRHCLRHRLTPRQRWLSKETSRWKRAPSSPPPSPPGPPLSSTRPRWCQTMPTWSSQWGKRRRSRGDTLRTSPKRAPTAVWIPPSRQLRTVQRYPLPPFPPLHLLTTHLLPLCQKARIPGSRSHRTDSLQRPRTCLPPTSCLQDLPPDVTLAREEELLEGEGGAEDREQDQGHPTPGTCHPLLIRML